MSKRKERSNGTHKAKAIARSQVEDMLKTLMCTVQTWDRPERGDEILRSIEEHSDVYPTVVIKEFKKAGHHGQRWFAGMISSIKDFAPIAGQLAGAVMSPGIDIEVKKDIAELLDKRGYPLDPEIVSGINRGHELSPAIFISELKGEEGAEKIREKLPQIMELPDVLSKSFMREVMQEAEGHALPMTRMILEEGNDNLSLFMVELLGAASSGEFHGLLMELSEDKSKGKLQKEAKRVLYRLKASGVNLKESKSTHESILKAPSYNFIGARAGLIDGEGSRMLWLARTKALGGIHFINFFVNDIKGIIECQIYETSKKNYEEVMSVLEQQYDGVIDMDPEYCRYLIEQAAALNSKSDTELPEEYLDARHILGKMEKSFDRAIIYDFEGLREEDIYPNPLLLNGSEDLFKLDEFMTWVLSAKEVEGYNFKLQEAKESRIVLSEISQKERVEEIIHTAADDLFQDELKGIYRRRLEENALILHQSDKPDQARTALVAAMAMDDEQIPPRKHPFILELIRRSLTLADEESSDSLISPP